MEQRGGAASKLLHECGRPPAYGFFLPQEGGKSHFSAAGDAKTKKHFKFQKRPKIVEISLASRPLSQPQRHARLLPLYNFALGGAFAPKSLLFGRWHLQARRKIVLIGSKPLLVLICHLSRCRDGASIPWQRRAVMKEPALSRKHEHDLLCGIDYRCTCSRM